MATNTNLNFTQESNFLFVISDNSIRELEFYVREFSGLGLSIGDMQPQSFLGQIIKRPGDSLTFNDISLTVLVDEEYQVLEEIYNFIQKIKNSEENTLEWNTNFSGILFPTTNKNNLKKKIEFENCWIKDMGDITFQASATEHNPIITTVTLSYDKYTFKDV